MNAVISCSACHNTLPDWAQRCQFCGADVTKVARPAAVSTKPRPYAPSATWIWPVYYALCAYWVISGLGHAAEAYHTAVTPVTIKMFGASETITPGFGFGQILGLVFAAFQLFVGVGLAARVEIARGIANFLAALGILFGLAGLAGSFMGALVFGPWAIFGIVRNTLDIVVGAMTIYLIGETEKSAPNF